jgi:hypothetical protein
MDDLVSINARLRLALDELLGHLEQVRRERDLARERLGGEQMPHRAMVPLKTVSVAGLSYESARRLVVRGDVEGERRGGRWFVSEASLWAFVRRFGRVV